MVKVTDLKNKLEEASCCIDSYDDNGAGCQPDNETLVTDIPASSPSSVQADVSETTDGCDLSEKVAGNTSEDRSRVIYDDAAFQLIHQKIAYFEDMLSEVQLKIEEGISQNSGSLNALKDEISSFASNKELTKLRREFDLLRKKLNRVVKDEDAFNGQSLNASKVPPDVLQITYSKTLNDLYRAILGIYGDSEAEAIVNSIRDNVRGFCAGVDFFRFEEGTFVVKDLSDAIQSRLVSTKQIHGTYIEIFKRMAEYAPNYESQDFRSFVETGSREYSVEKIAEHNRRLKDLECLVNKYLQELDNVSENMGFVAQLQNHQLDEIKAKSEDIVNIKGQISSLSHAVNLHTRLFKKLNSNLENIRSHLELVEGNSDNKAAAQDILSISSEISQAVPSKTELAALAASLNDLREQTSLMVSELYSRVDSVFSDVRGIESVAKEVSLLQEQLQKLRFDMQEDIMYIDLGDIEDVTIYEDEQFSLESDMYIDLDDLHEVTGTVVNRLVDVGPSTFKQLQKALAFSKVKLDEEELIGILDEALSSGSVTLQKKGRYLYYSASKE